MEQSTMFSENIVYLYFCTIIKMSASRVDKFSAGWNNCRSPISHVDKDMVEQYHTNPQSISKEYLNHPLGLTLSTPGLVSIIDLGSPGCINTKDIHLACVPEAPLCLSLTGSCWCLPGDQLLPVIGDMCGTSFSNVLVIKAHSSVFLFYFNLEG